MSGLMAIDGQLQVKKSANLGDVLGAPHGQYLAHCQCLINTHCEARKGQHRPNWEETWVPSAKEHTMRGTQCSPADSVSPWLQGSAAQFPPGKTEMPRTYLQVLQVIKQLSLVRGPGEEGRLPSGGHS
jgi:hypothetical protein